MDALRTLGEIEDCIRYAREALLDEHEGNFRHFVGRARDLTQALDNLVRSW